MLPDRIIEPDVDAYRADWWTLSLMQARAGQSIEPPDLVVKPRDADEVAMCLRYARENGKTVIPRGGGSGVCGGAKASAGSMVMDLCRMNHIGQVDETSMTVEVGSGTTGPDLESALNESGLTLGHMPQSFHISTVGGWVSTKATGQFSTRYGGIEERILSLEAVLADGTFVAGKATPRSAAGPDWWRMLIGAEGTLGIVTSATLSAFAEPQHHRWLVRSFPDIGLGIEACRLIMRSMLRPSVVRLYDQADSALNFGPAGYATDMPLMLVRFEGEPAMVEAEASIAQRICDETSGALADPSLANHWWSHRFKAADSYQRILSSNGPLGPFGVAETIEVSATWHGLANLHAMVRDAISPHVDIVAAHVSHLYMSGANIYLTFLISGATSHNEAIDRYNDAWDSAMQACLSAGGSISHHHGIGVVRRRWMQEELGSGLAALRRLKDSFDPEGLLNPGKLLPE
ncbi:MAG: FAD-binding oxidoreductase [Actinomycetota bacterium]|nr:FAD-binding oxidoreductase [Actinomycetota bacterium]